MTRRRPAAAHLAGHLAGVREDCDVLAVLVPLVAQHVARERSLPHAHGLPETAVRCDRRECSGSPHDGLGRHPERYDTPNEMDASDPTGESVVHLVKTADDRSLAIGDQVLADWFEALDQFRTASMAVFAQGHAMTAAIRAGRPATSGETEHDRLLARTGAREAESACLVCDLGVSEVGPLHAGLCDTHYGDWVAAGRPIRGSLIADWATEDDNGRGVTVDRWTAGWIADRRAELEADRVARTDVTGAVVQGPWGEQQEAA